MLAQLEFLEELGEQVRLLRQQNDLLKQVNKDLKNQLSKATKPIPYILLQKKQQGKKKAEDISAFSVNDGAI